MNTEVRTRIPDELLAMLDEIGEREHKCRSLLIRSAIAQLVDHYFATNEVFCHSRQPNGRLVSNVTFSRYINSKLQQDGIEQHKPQQ